MAMNSQSEFHTDAAENRVKVCAEFSDGELENYSVQLLDDNVAALFDISEIFVNVQGKLTPLSGLIEQEIIERGPDNA